MTDRLTALVATALEAADLPGGPDQTNRAVGVAVSGGGDSMALLHVMHDVCTAQGIALHVATVDHGLRAEAAAEAALVARRAAALNLPHDTLRWTGWNGRGNLQDAARSARYDLMSDWARAAGLGAVALGHTADDQAETVLMRLARRAGVDGLSGMYGQSTRSKITWIRPLLAARRADLRAYLTDHGVPWAEDPSNEDSRFERIRTRKALEVLEGLGIDAAVLGDVALNMQAARRVLEQASLHAARGIMSLNAGAVVFDASGLAVQPAEIRRRLVTHALTWQAGAPYGPRSKTVQNVLTALEKGKAATAHGCEIRRKGEKLWIFREFGTVQASVSAPDAPGRSAVWNGRWRITAPLEQVRATDRFEIRTLGPQGLARCGDWRAMGVPRGALMATPAVWMADQLIAAPLAGWGENWQAEVDGGQDALFAALITH